MSAPPLPALFDQGLAVSRALKSPENVRPASLPVESPTKAFWTHASTDSNPFATEGSHGALINVADICIIGSGITGVSIAYHLSNLVTDDDRRPRVVIVEARDFCSGATGRNGGHLTARNFLDFASDWKAHGLEDAKRAFAIEEYTATEIARFVREHALEKTVDYVVGGRTVPALSEDELETMKISYEAAKSAGLDISSIEWLSSDQAHERYGISHPAIHQPGSNLWPLQLVTAFYRTVQEARKLDVHVHTRTPVTAIDGGPGDWILRTPRGPISAPIVIHATNGYASYLLPQLAGYKYNGIVPVRGQVLALRAGASADALTRSSWLANDGFEYWFPRPVKNGEERPIVIFGGGRESAGPAFETFESDDSVVNPMVGSTLRRFLPAIFPNKYEEGDDILMEWTGIMGHTSSGDPLVGPVMDSNGGDKAYAGQFICAGYTGHGMPRAYACAEVIARMVFAKLNGSDEWEVPSWLPRHYLTSARQGDKSLTS